MPLTGPEVLLYRKEGPIAYITLNRPERLNALSPELEDRLAETWVDFREDPNLRVAIVNGAGDRAFCSGVDLRIMAETKGASRARGVPYLPGEGGVEVWKPIIAAIHGICYAGGWMLVQHCDIRIASDDAQFGIMEAKRNLGASWSAELTKMIPLGAVLELLLTAQPISAQRAYDIGFVNRIVPRDQLLPAARQLAEAICENAPMAVRFMKEYVYRGLDLTRDQAKLLGRYITAPLPKSEDAEEGRRAFVEKRKPAWKGR